MKIIDAHIHTSFYKKDLQAIAKSNGITFSLKGLQNEMKKNNIAYVFSITDSFKDDSPMGMTYLTEQMQKDKRIIGIGGINPSRLSSRSIKNLKKYLSKKLLRGLKIYLGYFWKYPFDKVYNEVYDLAEKYDCPVVFHTGDTLASAVSKPLLKYARPLNLDELAVARPKLKIIIAHAGYPWVMDAAEVAYKNKNVYVDISGWAFGKNFDPNNKRRIREMIDYLGPDKILYGTDWPLVRMGDYLAFFKKAIPKKYHRKIFYENAKKLFKL
jgi:predicted TIM-barrel fold metal-dependent hydrolase